MNRKYVYLIAVILCIVFVGSEHYVDLSMGTIDLELNESSRYVESPEIYEEPDNVISAGTKEIESVVSLSIINTQNDKNKITYRYKLKINEVSGAFRYTYNNEEKYLLFSATGESEITINSNESITIYDLPVGTTYTIEQISNSDSKYTIKANNVIGTTTTGTLSKDTKIKFENNVPVKENTITSNPYTADIYTLGIILFLIATTIFIAIKHVKIRRFE